MVRYTGPPADRQRGGQPPQSIYQTKKSEWCDKNSQPSENKGVISKSSVLFTATDEGDDGVGSVIDTTKVTSSTPGDDSPAPSDSPTSRRHVDDASMEWRQQGTRQRQQTLEEQIGSQVV